MSRTFDEKAWRRRLRDADLRVTRARMEVLRALAASPAPISAPEVLEQLSGDEIDRVTVYRTLNLLVDSGLADRLDMGNRVWRYGLASAAHADHAHFVCESCGEVRCLSGARVEVTFDAEARVPGLRVTHRELFLRGMCERCDAS